MLRSSTTWGHVNSSVFISPVSGNARGSRPCGATGPKSTTSAPVVPAWCTTIKPIPPRPLFQGSIAASAKAVATTASTAVPPAASTSAPTLAAVPFCAATIPPRDDTPGLRISQFWVRCILPRRLCDRDRVDPAGVEGIVAGEPGNLVVGRRVGPDNVLRTPSRSRIPGNLDRPIRGFALEGAAGVMFGRMHQIQPHVFFGKIIDRSMAGLFDAQRGIAVGDRDAAEDDTDAPAFRQQADAIFRTGDKTRGAVGHVGSSKGLSGMVAFARGWRRPFPAKRGHATRMQL